MKSVQLSVSYDDHPEDVVFKFEKALNELGIGIDIDWGEESPKSQITISKEEPHKESNGSNR